MNMSIYSNFNPFSVIGTKERKNKRASGQYFDNSRVKIGTYTSDYMRESMSLS